MLYCSMLYVICSIVWFRCSLSYSVFNIWRCPLWLLCCVCIVCVSCPSFICHCHLCSIWCVLSFMIYVLLSPLYFMMYFLVSISRVLVSCSMFTIYFIYTLGCLTYMIYFRCSQCVLHIFPSTCWVVNDICSANGFHMLFHFISPIAYVTLSLLYYIYGFPN